MILLGVLMPSGYEFAGLALSGRAASHSFNSCGFHSMCTTVSGYIRKTSCFINEWEGWGQKPYQAG
jgi:hypothetical protein